MNHTSMIVKIQRLSCSWSGSAQADPVNSNYSSLYTKGGSVDGLLGRNKPCSLCVVSKNAPGLKSRHNNNYDELCCHSKEGTSKNLIFSCPAALGLAATGRSLEFGRETDPHCERLCKWLKLLSKTDHLIWWRPTRRAFMYLLCVSSPADTSVR